MKTIKFLFEDLNTDERQILGSIILGLFGAALIIWLMFTNTYPVLTAKTRNEQTYKQNTYELKSSYNKYMNHVYNDKFK